MFAPIHARTKKIVLGDLFFSAEFIRTEGEKVLGHSYDGLIMAQPSATGLALIASNYNARRDQVSNIYVASTEEEFVHAITKAKVAPTGSRFVLVYMPTNIKVPKMYKHYTIQVEAHRTVFYFQKDAATLHVFNVDSATSHLFEFYLFEKLKAHLHGIHCTYYFQVSIFAPNSQKQLPLQATRWQCGVHALRMARALAKCPDVLGQLSVMHVEESSPTLNKIRYQLPAIIARNAEGTEVRGAFTAWYGTRVPRVLAFYAKYSGPLDYTIKWSKKFEDLLIALFNAASEDELAQKVALGTVTAIEFAVPAASAALAPALAPPPP